MQKSSRPKYLDFTPRINLALNGWRFAKQQWLAGALVVRPYDGWPPGCSLHVHLLCAKNSLQSPQLGCCRHCSVHRLTCTAGSACTNQFPDTAALQVLHAPLWLAAKLHCKLWIANLFHKQGHWTIFWEKFGVDCNYADLWRRGAFNLFPILQNNSRQMGRFNTSVLFALSIAAAQSL